MKFYGVHFGGSYASGLGVFVANSEQEAEELANDWLRAEGEDGYYGFSVADVVEYTLNTKGYVEADLYME